MRFVLLRSAIWRTARLGASVGGSSVSDGGRHELSEPSWDEDVFGLVAFNSSGVLEASFAVRWYSKMISWIMENPNVGARGAMAATASKCRVEFYSRDFVGYAYFSGLPAITAHRVLVPYVSFLAAGECPWPIAFCVSFPFCLALVRPSCLAVLVERTIGVALSDVFWRRACTAGAVSVNRCLF